MAKLSKREFKELEAKMYNHKKADPERDTFVGCRPTTFIPKHLRRANDRREAKALCKSYVG